ncbi:MAG TPA: sigma-70 family RNA polymerase sigma factor, partial [Myxococcaceae bacterium]|nr:sigma-70 family RNA polymerase sigma factor [Myxococcaceae bacterium]
VPQGVSSGAPRLAKARRKWARPLPRLAFADRHQPRKNHARQERRWQRAPVEALDKATAGVPSVLETLEVSERERLARVAVLKLPKGQREVLTLRIDAELPFAEIAEVLGISENNAKVHFHHAVKRLKLLIGQSVFEEPL